MIQNLVLRYHSSVVKNEISPHQSPSHFFDDTVAQTTEGPERDELPLFRGPVRSGACLLCRGSHLLTPVGNYFNCVLLVGCGGECFATPLKTASATSHETRHDPRLAPPSKESHYPLLEST